MVSCVNDVLNAANKLARAGNHIDESHQTCQTATHVKKAAKDFPHGKVLPRISHVAEESCATNVLGVVGAFEAGASSLTLVTGFFCQPVFGWNSIHSLCAAEIMKLVHAIQELVE